MTFKTMAAEEKWRILSAQNFYATPNASDANATEQLRNIKGTGQTSSGFYFTTRIRRLSEGIVFIFESSLSVCSQEVLSEQVWTGPCGIGKGGGD